MPVFTREQRVARFLNLVNPDQRSAFFKANIKPEVVDLSTAENILLLSFLQQNAFVNLGPVDQNTVRYPSPYIYGEPNIRKSLATFLQDQWGVAIDYNDIFGASGVVAGLELLALALFKPGDELLVPAPLWYGFPWSFSQSAGMKLIPFQISDGVNLTLADVEAAVEQNPNAKLLVLTNPNNPLGVNYSRDLLEQIYSFFLQNPDRHIISDEIYAGSQVRDPSQFVTALSLNAYQTNPDRIHVTWGLSKDFGLAGFRAGFIITQSPVAQNALLGDSCEASSVWFSPFVTLNPYMLKRLFFDNTGAPDPALANQAMTEYKGLLQQQYSATAEHLQGGNIPFYAENFGAIFFWIDLRAYLDRVPDTVSDQPRLCPELYSNDDPREQRLLNYINQEADVLLVRGQECFNIEPGFFRLCYTAEELNRVTMGIDNMVQALNRLPAAP
jgi:aspartate/methionine/tyrosine aminotransferase